MRLTYAVLGHVARVVSGIVHADHRALVVVEERSRWVAGSLGVQVNDVHERRDHQGVAQRRRQAVSHRERIHCRRPVPVRVLVPGTGPS